MDMRQALQAGMLIGNNPNKSASENMSDLVGLKTQFMKSMAGDNIPTGVASDRQPEVKERIATSLADALGGEYGDQQRGKKLSDLAEFIPGVGDSMAAGEAREAFENNRPGEGAFLTGAAGLGMVPVVGKPAAKALKAGVKKLKGVLGPEDMAKIADAERRTFGIKGRDDYIQDAIKTGNMVDAPFRGAGPKISLEDALNLDKNVKVSHLGKGYADRNLITPEDLVPGQDVLTPLVGDHMTGGRLTQTASGPVDVKIPGGSPYMQNEKTGIWASEKVPLSRIANTRLDFPDKRIVGVTTPMTHKAIDASRTVTDTFFQKFDPKVISNKDASEIDKTVRSAKKVPDDYPGIKSPGFKDWIDQQTMSARSAVVLGLDKGKFQKMGIPSFGELRHALSRPETRYMESSPDPLVGHNLGAMNPDAPIRPVSSTGDPHGTYSYDLPGEYLGGFDVQMPRSEVFPTWNKYADDRGLTGALKQGSFRQNKVTEPVTQQLIDALMSTREKVLRNR